MPNKLSHSSCNIYQDCPTKWKFHYQDRLRSKTQSAALIFGSAIDAALTSLMKGKDKDPKDVFAYFWRFAEINNKDVFIPTCTDIAYANSDLDLELLEEDDIGKIKEEYGITDLNAEVKKLQDEKDYAGFNNLPQDRKKLFNHINWFSLYRKGLLMIKCVQEKIMPNIIEVLGVQEYVILENAEDDKVIGYADLVCKWKGKDKPVVLDWKTSSIEYKTDAVLTSPQLTLYVHSLSEKFDNTRNAGYIVLHKQVRKNKTKVCSICNKDGTGQRHKTCDAETDGKRCNGDWIVKLDPEIYFQILIDEIPLQTEEIVIENYDYINTAIKTNVFHRNFGSCFKAWGPCQYFKKCFYNSDEDLIKLDEKSINKK